jgi:hypothetical protein
MNGDGHGHSWRAVLPRWATLRVAAATAAAIAGALAVAITVGCNAVATADDWASHTVGAAVGTLLELSRTPDSYPAAHGGMTREESTPAGGAWYRYPLGPRCDVLFEVDAQGVIRGWRAEGADC